MASKVTAVNGSSADQFLQSTNAIHDGWMKARKEYREAQYAAMSPADAAMAREVDEILARTRS